METRSYSNTIFVTYITCVCVCVCVCVCMCVCFDDGGDGVQGIQFPVVATFSGEKSRRLTDSLSCNACPLVRVSGLTSTYPSSFMMSM